MFDSNVRFKSFRLNAQLSLSVRRATKEAFFFGIKESFERIVQKNGGDYPNSKAIFAIQWTAFDLVIAYHRKGRFDRWDVEWRTVVYNELIRNLLRTIWSAFGVYLWIVLAKNLIAICKVKYLQLVIGRESKYTCDILIVWVLLANPPKLSFQNDFPKWKFESELNMQIRLKFFF